MCVGVGSGRYCGVRARLTPLGAQVSALRKLWHEEYLMEREEKRREDECGLRAPLPFRARC